MAAVLPMLVSSAETLSAKNFSLANVPDRVEPASLLMCAPTYFDVKDVKNPFMCGNVSKCDTVLAGRQWEELKAIYERLGYTVQTLPPAKDVEDMVFAANQVLPGHRADGSKFVILSNMVHESRRREVPLYADWFATQGYEILRISDDFAYGPRFEGQGDAIWHPGKQLLWGGYGHRTERAAYERISELTGAMVLLLELVNDKCYHLDTSLCVLDQKTALIYPAAFSKDGIGLLRAVFEDLIEVPDDEALNFAGNAIGLGKHVVLQKGSVQTCRKLRDAGYEPIEVDTSEFMKSGGSVFCMKMMVY